MTRHILAIFSCMICGKVITPQFWVCADCQAAHKLSDRFADWPDWAKRLKADHKAARIQEREILANEGGTWADESKYNMQAYGDLSIEGE